MEEINQRFACTRARRWLTGYFQTRQTLSISLFFVTFAHIISSKWFWSYIHIISIKGWNRYANISIDAYIYREMYKNRTKKTRSTQNVCFHLIVSRRKGSYRNEITREESSRVCVTSGIDDEWYSHLANTPHIKSVYTAGKHTPLWSTEVPWTTKHSLAAAAIASGILLAGREQGICIRCSNPLVFLLLQIYSPRPANRIARDPPRNRSFLLIYSSEFIRCMHRSRQNFAIYGQLLEFYWPFAGEISSWIVVAA